MRAPLLPAVAAAALLGTVVLANVLSAHFGLVSAGFGLTVSAGTYAAGLALGLRDLLDRAGGLRWVLGAIAAGIVVSAWAASPQLAVASAAAFAVSELVDLTVWRSLRRTPAAATPPLLRDSSGRGAYRPGPASPPRRSWRVPLVASNAAGALVDTLVFLPLAGFGLTASAVGGQFLVKAVWMSLLALAVGELVSRARSRRAVIA